MRIHWKNYPENCQLSRECKNRSTFLFIQFHYSLTSSHWHRVRSLVAHWDHAITNTFDNSADCLKQAFPLTPKSTYGLQYLNPTGIVAPREISLFLQVICYKQAENYQHDTCKKMIAVAGFCLSFFCCEVIPVSPMDLDQAFSVWVSEVHLEKFQSGRQMAAGTPKHKTEFDFKSFIILVLYVWNRTESEQS